MYDDTQYKRGRAYYCKKCKQYEPSSETVREIMEHNDALNLPQIPMGSFIEEQVGKDLDDAGLSCTPVTVRVVSSLLMTSYTPERLVAHQEALGANFPKEFPYKSKALLAFQKRDGLDVCIFALYVQEYGPDCPEPNRNRVYISYLDSVRYFESSPAGHRSTVYHSMLVAYLQWTRMLGFKHVHIWVEPPKMGDEYIFFARSDQQRKPMKREKLREWYKKMLDKAKDKGIVDHYGSMHEHYNNLKSISEIPLFHGDQWEITVPSLLGIDSEDPNAVDPKKVTTPPFPTHSGPARAPARGRGGCPLMAEEEDRSSRALPLTRARVPIRRRSIPRSSSRWTRRTWCRRRSRRCSTSSATSSSSCSPIRRRRRRRTRTPSSRRTSPTRGRASWASARCATGSSTRCGTRSTRR